MTNTQADCVCAGIIVADHVCEPVARMPVPGELVLTPRMDLTTGGNATNVALDLARLGRSVEVVGVVGEDAFGDFVRQTLTAAGISCRHLGVSPSKATSGTFVINCEGEDRRFIHSIGANADFTAEEITPDLIGGGRILYLGGFCLCRELTPENVADVFQEARRQGIPTVLDIVIAEAQTAWEGLNVVLPHTDYFLPNNDEAASITGQSNPVAQAEMFREAGAKTVVVTCGENGAVLLSEETRLRAGTFPIQYVDGTGSGDAFSAGFIHGLLSDADLETCLRWGSALGASAVRTAGASTGVFSADKLEAFCQSYSLEIQTI